MAISAEHLGQNLQSFTVNGDGSIWVNNSRMGRKTPNKYSYFANIMKKLHYEECIRSSLFGEILQTALRKDKYFSDVIDASW